VAPGLLRQSRRFIAWERFSKYHAFIAARKASGAEALTMRLRKFRKLNREHNVRFECHAADESVFEWLIAWKSEQYIRLH
jgi:hypothetical protein